MARKRRKHHRVAKKQQALQAQKEKIQKFELLIGLGIIIAIWLEGYLVGRLVSKIKYRNIT